MFAKSMMKNVYLPKISILLQFGSKIVGILGSNDSRKILLMFRTEIKLHRFVLVEEQRREKIGQRSTPTTQKV